MHHFSHSFYFNCFVNPIHMMSLIFQPCIGKILTNKKMHRPKFPRGALILLFPRHIIRPQGPRISRHYADSLAFTHIVPYTVFLKPHIHHRIFFAEVLPTFRPLDRHVCLQNLSRTEKRSCKVLLHPLCSASS